MRLIRPADSPGKSSPTSRVSRAYKPQWLREYIEDQGKFALLSCGHKLNVNERAVSIIIRRLGAYVVCERCGEPMAVVRYMKFREYAELPAIVESDIPLF
jgi:hypothetical protein